MKTTMGEDGVMEIPSVETDVETEQVDVETSTGNGDEFFVFDLQWLVTAKVRVQARDAQDAIDYLYSYEFARLKSDGGELPNGNYVDRSYEVIEDGHTAYPSEDGE